MKLRSSGVSWREIDGEMVILDLASSTYLTTNETGTVLMRLLTEDRDIDTLAATLMTEFDISREQAVQDVEQFVRMLAQNGLLEQVEPPTH